MEFGGALEARIFAGFEDYVWFSNMVTSCYFDKGRGRSWAMNAARRRVCACQLAANLRPRGGHVDSEYWAADGGSRGLPARPAVTSR